MTPSQATVCHETLKTRSNIATCGSLRCGAGGPRAALPGGGRAQGRAVGGCRAVCLSVCLSATASGGGGSLRAGLCPPRGRRPVHQAQRVMLAWEAGDSNSPPVVKERVCWFKRGESLIFSSFLRSGTGIGDPAECLFVVLTEYLEPHATLVCDVGFSAAPLTSLGYTCREFWLQVSYTRRQFASYWQVSGWVLSLTVVKNYTQR